MTENNTRNYYKIYSVFISIFFLISLFVIFGINRSHKFEKIRNNTVSRVELQNTIKDNDSFVTGRVVGFVAFEDITKQPLDLKQYYIIEAGRGLNGEQSYTLQNIIAFNNLAPSIGEKEVLTITNNQKGLINLEDSEGNLFRINILTGEILLHDRGGDSTKIITRDSEYRDFIEGWLKQIYF